MAVLTYVDDCIFFRKDLKKIDESIARLKWKFDLTVEEAQGEDQDVFAYLGVKVQVEQVHRGDDISTKGFDSEGVEGNRNAGLQCKALSCTIPVLLT